MRFKTMEESDEIEKVLDQLLIARGEHPIRVRNPLYKEERELAKALLNHFIGGIMDNLKSIQERLEGI